MNHLIESYFRQMTQLKWLFLTLSILLESKLVQSSECYSCLSSCKILPNGMLDMEDCDCRGNTTCSAQNCFVKVELFTMESTAIVQVRQIDENLKS
jgi:hypothetical protein